MDKWALSRLNSLVREVDADLNEYKIFEASRAMTGFRGRPVQLVCPPPAAASASGARGMAGDKEAAFATLYHILETMSRPTAPFTPFMAESMYRNLVATLSIRTASISVHMTDFRSATKSNINTELEQHMRDLLEVVVLGRSCRNESGFEGSPAAVPHDRQRRNPAAGSVRTG